MFKVEDEPTDVIQIQVGKLKGVGVLRPGNMIFPIGIETWPIAIGGVFYDALVVECPEFATVDDPQPTAVVPPLLYESRVIRGKKLFYVQVPVKFGMLNTTHALTGRAAEKLMLTIDYVWCHDAIVSAMTRASQPPPPIGVPLAGLQGAVGIRVLNNMNGRFFDPCFLALGLHPKVALLFHDVFAKPVPSVCVDWARKWVEAHNAYHLRMETRLIERKKARAAAGPSTRQYN
eukprot:2461728-Prymnesium_polylepis.1